jgi:hypothetical protein
MSGRGDFDANHGEVGRANGMTTHKRGQRPVNAGRGQSCAAWRLLQRGDVTLPNVGDDAAHGRHGKPFTTNTRIF